MNKIIIPEWDLVRNYVDTNYAVTGSYVDRVASGKYPRDAFSLGQLASKAWLLSELRRLSLPSPGTVAMLGCWVGSIVESLLQEHQPDRIYGFDQDPVSIQLAEEFNQRWVQEDWWFKGVVADVNMLDMSDLSFEVSGEIIDCRPDWIINTSCEHMSTDWFDTVGDDQLVIMQTNDSTGFEGHINVCEDLAEVQDLYPLSRVLYSGEMITPLYTRFMQIGYR